MSISQTQFNPLNIQKIKQGVNQGLFQIQDNYIYYLKSDNRRQKITEKDPEEIVRAEMYFDLVNKYKYQPEDIGVEIPVKDGSGTKYVDIVVYDKNIILPDGRRQIFMILECKKLDILDQEFQQAILQAASYANKERAKYAVTTNGVRTEVAQAVDVRDYESLLINQVGSIPIDYGEPLKWKLKKGDKENDLLKKTKDDLIRVFKRCNQILWDSGQLNPLEAFDEMSKIIYAKIRDEQATGRGKYYQFQTTSKESAEETFERISKLYETGREKNEDVFKDPIKVSAVKLVSVVREIQEIDLNRSEIDSKGLAFEVFMKDFFKGNAGQFFTPREVVEFIVRFVDEMEYSDGNPNGINEDTLILDPACGSSGFLLGAFKRFREKTAKILFDLEDSEDRAKHSVCITHFAHDNLFGIELNRSLARVSKMNMIVHGDGRTNIAPHDALADLEDIRQNSRNFNFNENHFDIILSNPPFGGAVSSSEKMYLRNYELGKNQKTGKVRNTQKTEILFIERIWQFLKQGGKAGIILPDGILTNSSLEYVRDFIFDKFKILAVVSLPQTTFSHYGAGVKTSVIFVQKWKNEREKELELKSEYPIFMAKAENIGYNATGRETGKSDFKDIIKKYREFSESYDKSDFFV